MESTSKPKEKNIKEFENKNNETTTNKDNIIESTSKSKSKKEIENENDATLINILQNEEDISDDTSEPNSIDTIEDEPLITIRQQEEQITENILQPTERQSNVELLRIIAMLLIISHHFAVHGKFDFADDDLALNRFWVQFLTIGGKISVDCYVLITGYFLINSKKIKINKLIRLILQIQTYSLLTFSIGYYLKIDGFNLLTLVMYVFPISFDIWWFASNYVILYVLSTSINVLLNSYDKKGYRNFMILITVIWCILPTITSRFYCISDLIWFIYLYCLSGYLRKYPIWENLSSIKCIGISIAFYLLIFIIAIICDFLGVNNRFFAYMSGYFFGMNKIPILLSAVFLFIGFLKFNIKNRLINFISATTFGIYLLHDSPALRIILWEKVFKNNTYKYSNLLVPYSIGAILVVFIVSSIVEIIRSYTIEKLYLRLVDNVSLKLDYLIQKIINSNIINRL